MGFMPENRFGAGRQARVPLVSKSSGPCDSALVRLGVSFALVGVGDGEIVRIRVWNEPRGRAFCPYWCTFCPYWCTFCPLVSMDFRGSARIGSLGSAITAFFAALAGRFYLTGNCKSTKLCLCYFISNPLAENLMEKLIITTALTGAVTVPAQSPHLPLTPDEIASDAIACADAGAAAVQHSRRNPQDARARF